MRGLRHCIYPKYSDRQVCLIKKAARSEAADISKWIIQKVEYVCCGGAGGGVLVGGSL